MMHMKNLLPSASLSKGETAAVSGTVISSVYVNKVRNLQIVTVTIADATGKLPVTWFNTPYLRSTLKRGSSFVFVVVQSGSRAGF